SARRGRLEPPRARSTLRRRQRRSRVRRPLSRARGAAAPADERDPSRAPARRRAARDGAESGARERARRSHAPPAVPPPDLQVLLPPVSGASPVLSARRDRDADGPLRRPAPAATRLARRERRRARPLLRLSAGVVLSVFAESRPA